MKKSLLALAVLGAFAGTAMAQSAVTLYGLIDENLGKDMGSAALRMSQGGSSRLGFRGIEDLGGGAQAFFQIEHRFRPWNGTINGGNGFNGTPVTFWQARSYVGLRGGWGDLRLGREYDGAFFHAEVSADPWGWDTVVSSMTVPVDSGTAINNFNVNRAITYSGPGMGGFNATIQYAESNENCGTGITIGGIGLPASFIVGSCRDNPYSFGVSYAGGPMSLGFGYNNPGNLNDEWMMFRGNWDFGMFKLWGSYGTGKNTADQTVKSWLLAATMTMGQGEFRVAYMEKEDNSIKNISGLGLGYHYALSKRTTLYADYAQNSKLPTEKDAYDFGIKHTF